ncbi:MAG TPA: hypothetical protein VH601_06310 [Bryobacteraceae bacterium]|jgi:hypothetical protein
MIAVCPKCQIALAPKKNGVTVEVMSDFGSYQLWDADLLECPECRLEIVSNFGKKPLMEHYQKPAYERTLEYLRYHGPVVQAWETRRDKERYHIRNRCDQEIQHCRDAGRTALTDSERVGAMQGEVDWMVARQMAEEDSQ